MSPCRGLVISGLVGLLSMFVVAADPQPGQLVVRSRSDQEVTLASPRYGSGFRKLGWLAKQESPLAFVLREPVSTNYAKGVETWLPLTHLERIEFDKSQQAISVRVAGLKAPLSGGTQFKGINTLVLEAGKTRYSSQGGKDEPILAVRFPEAKPAPAITGPRWTIQIDYPKLKNPTLTVANLKVLQVGPAGREQLLPSLPARRGAPLELDAAKVTRMEVVAVESARAVALEVTLSDGREQTVVVPTVSADKSLLMGLVGEVPGGYQYFPWHTIQALKPLAK